MMYCGVEEIQIKIRVIRAQKIREIRDPSVVFLRLQ
jgi:hypothetical protein